MRVLVVQHDHVSPLGPVGEKLVDHGYDLQFHQVVDEADFHDPRVDVTFPDVSAFDAAVVMGARWSAYDHDLIGSWVRPEIDLLRSADDLDVPVLGICFGGQLLALAHGGRVEAAPAPEVGWTHVDSDDVDVVPSGDWFQWHFDRWTTPPGATEIARSPAAPQAFRLRRNLALQFHPELTSAMLDGWLRNGGVEVLIDMSVDPEVLVAETRRRDSEARARAHLLVDAFVRRVARGND